VARGKLGRSFLDSINLKLDQLLSCCCVTSVEHEHYSRCLLSHLPTFCWFSVVKQDALIFLHASLVVEYNR
jgi:hypothetical protein